VERPVDDAFAQKAGRTVYLIGCDHNDEQTYRFSKGPDAKHFEFRRALYEAVQNHNPDLIAEEFHPELLKSRKRQSIALEVSSETGICHRFCDLSEAERHSLGIGVDFPWSWIPSDQTLFQKPQPLEEVSDHDWHKHNIAHRFPIREDFWISQLRTDTHETVIFVCGAMHVPTFKKRLEGKNIKAGVIADFVGFDPKLRNTEEFAAREDVLKCGFAPVTNDADPRCFCIRQRCECPPETDG
jgi:hypothetical protein